MEEGLNSGLYTFTMKCGTPFGGQVARFADRLIVVQPF
jgi:hypothetical protein